MPTRQPPRSDAPPDQPERFSVDTHLFRELGRLLVGRDSTALVELIKNAYDADATKVIVDGTGLHDELGSITVADDGNGMTPQEFRDGFLRVAARSKDTDTRRSPRFRRRFTGAKGIGRLSAHKLATRIDVFSVPHPDVPRAEGAGVDAWIDWDEIEEQQSLESLEYGIEVTPVDPTEKDPGTTILLKPLRRPWREDELGAFVAEAHTFRPPPAVVAPLPKDLFEAPLLFRRLTVADQDQRDKGFKIELRGDFEVGEALWSNLIGSMDWVVEVDARGDDVTYGILPSRRLQREDPDLQPYRFVAPHPRPGEGPYFTARIFARVGSYGPLKDFATSVGGIRVYMEGFRVLPYGEPTDDWLGIDRDYVRRNRNFRINVFPGQSDDLPRETDRSSFPIAGNDQYVGAVLLTERQAPELEMLINREGFIPGPALDAVRRLVRQGIDLSTRVRAAAREATPVTTRSVGGVRRASARAAEPEAPLGEELLSRLKSTTDLAREMRGAATVDTVAVARLADALERATEHATVEVDELRDEQARIRILASVGSQLAAFVHEINALLAQAQTIASLLDRLASDSTLRGEQRRQVATAQGAAVELVEALTRQSSYLTDVIVNERRRRRRRNDVAERLDASVRMLAGPFARREIRLEVDLQPKLRTPPMFASEVTILFTNLLTNAIKAAGTKGRIRVTGHAGENATILRVENSGERVDLTDAERWFRPFETTTTEVDVILGQGMGLGLPITRALVGDYGGTIQFVRPSRGFATAVEVNLPERGGRR